MFKEFRVVWQQVPYVSYPKQVVFIKAASSNDASALAVDHLERRMGLHRSEFRVHEVSESVVLPDGKVL